MPPDDILTVTTVVQQVAVTDPQPFTLTILEEATNVVAVEVLMREFDFVADVPKEFHLDLMDGDLFVAADDSLLGTRLRTMQFNVVQDGTLFYQLPGSALRLYGFKINGLDYLERATLTLGTGAVVLDQNGGYLPEAGDLVLVHYSE